MPIATCNGAASPPEKVLSTRLMFDPASMLILLVSETLRPPASQASKVSSNSDRIGPVVTTRACRKLTEL